MSGHLKVIGKETHFLTPGEWSQFQVCYNPGRRIPYDTHCLEVFVDTGDSRYKIGCVDTYENGFAHFDVWIPASDFTLIVEHNGKLAFQMPLPVLNRFEGEPAFKRLCPSHFFFTSPSLAKETQ